MPSNPGYPRHETRALLRAHLSAATRYGHVIRHCPVCHRLQRLVLETPDAGKGVPAHRTAAEGTERDGGTVTAPPASPEEGLAARRPEPDGGEACVTG